MKNIWVVSDTHFNHSNFLKFTDSNGNIIRPFTSVAEMNELMMDRWAETVKPGDIVYHLGDVYFGNHDDGAAILRKLPGKKRLVIGNHDDVIEMVKRNMFQKFYTWRVWADKGLIFSHIPLHRSNLSLMKFTNVLVNVHGHIHKNDSPEGPYMNVSVEVTDYTPVHIDTLWR